METPSMPAMTTNTRSLRVNAVRVIVFQLMQPKNRTMTINLKMATVIGAQWSIKIEPIMKLLAQKNTQLNKII